MSAQVGTALRACHVPPAGAGAGDYVRLLTSALEREGIEILRPEEGSGLWPAPAVRPDVIHLHWLEFLASSDPGRLGWCRTAYRHLRLIARLLRWRRRRVTLVWTIHNLQPHEPVHPRLERMVSRAVLSVCNCAIAHSEYARARIGERYGSTDKVVVIPNGNYIDIYPSGARTRAQIRAALMMPVDSFAFLAFGQVRPYKQLEQLARTFSALEGDQMRLIIAGKPVIAAEAQRLRQLAALDPRIVLDLREIPDVEVGDIHAASDGAVFAYREVFSSGAVLLALSYGLPVIVPAPSAGSELGGVPVVYGFAPGGLGAALRNLSGGHQSAATGAAEAIAAQFGWDRVARETTQLYAGAVGERQSPHPA